ncbi:MAG TPA: hypothetical protein EYP85_14470 [Armatimonadetes bacterium]|nr:hypothetical protein [Armatimonadota bacterium]
MSGTLRYEFYELDSIVELCRQCLERGVSIKILVGKDWDTRTERIPRLLQRYAPASGLRVYRAPDPQPTPRPHFVVVDQKHVRIEEEHDEDAPIEEIRAGPIRWYDFEEAIRFAHAFYEMWDASSAPEEVEE